MFNKQLLCGIFIVSVLINNICVSGKKDSDLAQSADVIECLEDLFGISDDDKEEEEQHMIYTRMSDELSDRFDKEDFDKFCVRSKIRKDYKFKNPSNGKKRRLSSDDNDGLSCLSDSNTDFCSAADPSWTSGSDYDVVVGNLQNPGLGITSLLEDSECYTDGNAVSELWFDLFIAESVLSAAQKICETAVACGDPLFTDCAIATACLITVENAVLAKDKVKEFLELADLQDHLVLATQLQAVFLDRERIIANQNSQKVLNQNSFTELTNFIDNEFTDLTNFIDTEFTELTDFIDGQFTELTSFIDTRFNDLEALNIKLFNLQNQWMNTKFNDIFQQLDVVNKLIRTPNGLRPGWNEQTIIDEEALQITDVQIPQSTDPYP